DRLLQRVEHAAERAEQEQRHRHADQREQRAQLVAPQVHEHEGEEVHEYAPESLVASSPLSRGSTRGTRWGACGAWVTMMIVLWNSVVSGSSSCRISAADLRSRSPVGS